MTTAQLLLRRGAGHAERPGMSNTVTVPGRHRAPDAVETIALLADVDRAGRHAETGDDLPIYESLRAELAAVDWFSLGR